MPSLPPFDRSFAGAVKLSGFLKKTHPEIKNSHQLVIPGLVELIKVYKPEVNVTITQDLPTVYSLSILLREKLSNNCRIIVPPTFNKCYKRFAICKEVCHILTDDSTVSANTPSKELLLAIDPRKRIISADKSVFKRKSLKAEEFCIFLAIELMLADDRRDQIVTDTALQNASNYDMAKLFQIPEALIKFYIDSEYHEEWLDIS